MINTELWQAAEYYLDNGISIIPIRGEDETVNGTVRFAKTPIGAWKQFQTTIIDKAVLWDRFDVNPTAGFAIVTGKVSGSLELIDIDEKHFPGGSAIYLTEIKTLYPDVFDKLRIHKTRSGGYHLIYRCDELLTDGNMKLAVAHEMKEAWIETRGEGGYAVAPPAPGYTVLQDVPIPVLSYSERCCLIELARSFDSRVKIEKPHTPTQRDRDFYDENPWDHFNGSPAAEEILYQHGWTLYKDTAKYVYFTRPGIGSDKTTKKGVSASFNKETRIYYIFTSSTELDSGRGYRPSTLLSILQFGGNKKSTYGYLVESGYGRIKKKVETKLAKAAALKKGTLPNNFSPEAREMYQEEKNRLEGTYPYGMFWSGDIFSGFKINRKKTYEVATGLGFNVLDNMQDLVRIDGNIVRKSEPRDLFDALAAYIDEDESSTYDIVHELEGYMQRSGKYMITRLPIFDNSRVLASTKNVSYKFFENCVVVITKDDVTTMDYPSDKLVWEDLMLPREYVPAPFEGTAFHEFLRLGIEDLEHAKKCIGFLTHEYKDETMAYIIALTESVSNPKEGGGSGKNVFTNLLGYATTHRDIPGSQVQFNEKFLQAWRGEKIFSISDIPQWFDFAFLKNIVSNSAIVKRLFKDEETVEVANLPKIVFSTNYSYDVSDGGLKRRIKPIEFTDFFTKKGGVDEHFGMMFPFDWTESDWHGFDNFIIHCIQEFLRNPKIATPKLTVGGWLKQFDTIFSENTRHFIEMNLEYWKHIGYVNLAEFVAQYEAFCRANMVYQKFMLSRMKMNEALQIWCDKHDIPFDKNYRKGKRFSRERGLYFGTPRTENELYDDEAYEGIGEDTTGPNTDNKDTFTPF